MFTMTFIWSVLVVTALSVPYLDAHRFLLVPLISPSHVSYFTYVGEELCRNGHQVDILLPAGWKLTKSVSCEGFQMVTYRIQEAETLTAMPEDDQKEWLGMMGKVNARTVGAVRWLQTYSMPSCRNALSDAELFQNLQQKKYRLAIIDAVPLSRCFYVLLYKLGLEYISLTTQYDPWQMSIPAIPSVSPFPMAAAYSEKMTFWERLHNLYLMLDWYIWPGVETMDDKLVSTYVPEKEFVSIDHLARQSLLWFVNTDNAIDFARPTMPHIIYIGGVTCEPGKPLPSDFQTLIDKAEHGVIFVSFGSFATQVPDHFVHMLLQTFRQIKQKVIWKYDGSLLANIPENVKCVGSLPQASLLAHPKMQIFVSHGGNPEQFDALYHAVPMITIPLFAEQFYNAKRFEYKGYGTIIWLSEFSSERFLADINKISTDTSFKQRILKGSEIYKSSPMTALQRAVYWVEHVIEFGADHLRSHAIDMPWYQYWMADILVFFLVIFTVSIFLGLLLLKLLKHVCCQGKEKQKQQ